MNFNTAFADSTATLTQPTARVLNIQPEQIENAPAVVVPPELTQRVVAIMQTPLENVSAIGSECGAKMGALSDQVLMKVTAADTGELGKGITDVLMLTNNVNLAKYGEKNNSFFGKLKAKIVGATLDFRAEFETTSDRIGTIVQSLGQGLDRMRDDAVWLQNAYDANIEYHNELELTANAMQYVIDGARNEVQVMAQQPNVDVNVLQSKQMHLDRLEKHHDKLLRLIQLAKLTAPEIRQMQMTNFNTVQTFMDLRDITIPAWKKTISLGLLALQQKKDAEFSSAVQDAANDNLKKASDMINSNMIVAAQNANRSVVDMSTLEHVQNNMLNSLKQVQQIEQQGREDRRNAAIKLKQMEGDLRTQLIALSK